MAANKITPGMAYYFEKNPKVDTLHFDSGGTPFRREADARANAANLQKRGNSGEVTTVTRADYDAWKVNDGSGAVDSLNTEGEPSTGSGQAEGAGGSEQGQEAGAEGGAQTAQAVVEGDAKQAAAQKVAKAKANLTTMKMARGKAQAAVTKLPEDTTDEKRDAAAAKLSELTAKEAELQAEYDAAVAELAALG